MKIPNNSLTEEITEIARLCEELSEDYGDDASWFDPPATEEEIAKWEEENGIRIPESYKDWLRFTDSCQILNTLARLYGVREMEVNSKDCPEDCVLIGDIIGDGERLCFSKVTGKIIRHNHGENREFGDFKEILKRTVIRMLQKNF